MTYLCKILAYIYRCAILVSRSSALVHTRAHHTHATHAQYVRCQGQCGSYLEQSKSLRLVWTVFFFASSFFALPAVFVYDVCGWPYRFRFICFSRYSQKVNYATIESISFKSRHFRSIERETIYGWMWFVNKLPFLIINEINSIRLACYEACASIYVYVSVSVLWFVVQEFCRSVDVRQTDAIGECRMYVYSLEYMNRTGKYFINWCCLHLFDAIGWNVNT